MSGDGDTGGPTGSWFDIGEHFGVDEVMFAVDPSRTIGALIGMRLYVGGDGELEAELPVTDKIKQPMGIVNGGVYSVVSESLASTATARYVIPEGKICLGMSNNTAFFRPVSEGTIRATAVPRHRGRTSWVWQVDMHDGAGRLCATSTVTVAVRDLPSRD